MIRSSVAGVWIDWIFEGWVRLETDEVQTELTFGVSLQARRRSCAVSFPDYRFAGGGNRIKEMV